MRKIKQNSWRQIGNKLKQYLVESIKQNSAEALLLSGGLDTSILSAISYRSSSYEGRGSPNVICINISLENYSSDIKYAKILERFLNLKIHYLTIKMEEAISSVPEIIKILKSFDPAIPNDIPVYFGMKFAKALGLKSIMTGDGSDELFAGYDYMQNMVQLDSYIQKIADNMYFSSNELGKFLGIEVKQPYLDKEFIDFALSIRKNLKIRKQNSKIFGKWILRKTFEDILPKKIIWQTKRPLEYGSGMTKIRDIISQHVSEKEFKENPYHMKFMNKEHFYYYKIYKEIFGTIPRPKDGEKSCPACSAGISKQFFHCKVCGWTEAIK